MYTFIRALGPDITYEGQYYYFYIDPSKIYAAYPSYATKDKDGQLWQCTPDHEEAILIAYKLKYFDGNIFTCGNEEELNKLGLSLNQKQHKRGIGFVLDGEGNKNPEDITE